MEELDPFGFTCDQELHGIHIHQHHLFEIDGHVATVAAHMRLDFDDVRGIDAPDEVVNRRPVIARGLDPERHGVRVEVGQPEWQTTGRS
jgi:hypothetical protein